MRFTAIIGRIASSIKSLFITRSEKIHIESDFSFNEECQHHAQKEDNDYENYGIIYDINPEDIVDLAYDGNFEMIKELVSESGKISENNDLNLLNAVIRTSIFDPELAQNLFLKMDTESLTDEHHYEILHGIINNKDPKKDKDETSIKLLDIAVNDLKIDPSKGITKGKDALQTVVENVTKGINKPQPKIFREKTSEEFAVILLNSQKVPGISDPQIIEELIENIRSEGLRDPRLKVESRLAPQNSINSAKANQITPNEQELTIG